MTIYEFLYVHPDRLFSPKNHYSCKRITKQNIKQFGFGSLEELHTLYPKFPLITPSLSSLYSKKAKEEHIKGHNAKISSRKLKSQKEYYLKNLPICPKCGEVISFEKRNNKFCSRKCANSRGPRSEEFKQKITEKAKVRNSKKIKSKNINCTICNRLFSINIDRFKRSRSKIFSCGFTECDEIALSRIHKINGSEKRTNYKTSKRSKKEIKLYNLLKMHFKNIDHNTVIINGWDADIILYDYKIGILWNGPWHYQEMTFAKHSLKQVVNRDCLKIIEFEKIGWEILIYEDNVWTPETAMIDVLSKVNSRPSR